MSDGPSPAGARASRSGDQTVEREYYAVMSAFGDALLDAQSEDELWQRTSDALARGGPFSAACVARSDGEGGLQLADGAGPAHAALEGLHLRLDDAAPSPPALAWSTQEPCMDPDTREAHWLQAPTPPGLRCMLSLPVRRRNEVCAVLCVAADRVDAFDDAALDLCRRVGRLMERWLDHHLQLPHLQHQALHDPLTDLPNRRMLEEHLTATMARARRRGTVMALGVLDIDDFKPINDTCGHDAGDRLLRELGARLRDTLRRQDLLVRVGGDEFALVIDDLPAGRASAELAGALDRLHVAVEQPFELGQGRTAQVDMSLGVALYPFDGEEVDQLMRQADVAMYAAKANKFTRLQWWQLATVSGDAPQSEGPVATYGPDAAALLRQARPLLAQVSQRFVAGLTEAVRHHGEWPERSPGIDPTLVADHGGRLAEHLEALFHPDAEAGALAVSAERVGRVHALTGVGPDMVVRAVGLYRSHLSDQLAGSPLTARERYRLMQLAEERLQHELQHELSGHGDAIAEHYQVSAAPLPAAGTPWVDAMQAELEGLAALPGVRAVTVQRPDADGRLTVEAYAGKLGVELTSLTRRPDLVPLADTTHADTGSLVGRAWATGTLQSTRDYLADERTSAWREPLARVGVRSLLALPIRGSHERPAAILVLYGAWVGQFDAPWTRTFAVGLQQRWEALWRRSRDPLRAPALPQPLAEHYRERLFDGGLTVYLQPVVDLASGAVLGAEALARLRLEDGSIRSPGAFLPLLGEVELARLFRLTLDQALAALVAWDASDPGGRAHHEIAVNLSPSTLLEPDCPRWIADALARHGVAPSRLSLELIETEEIGEQARQRAIHGLHELGVRLAIDDLGSGYSSLQRLTELPFHTMKIDQALMNRMYEQPLQTLGLVRSLVRLGEDLGRRVVIEGAGDLGMVEVASVLGARYAQGFGIARPMPAEDLPAWQAGFRSPIRSDQLRTMPGALAWHWRARRKRLLAHPPSLSSCPLEAFLQDAGLANSEGAQWHFELHADAEATEASDRLTTWLIARVQRERTRS